MKSLPILTIFSLILLTRLFFYIDEKVEFKENKPFRVEHTFTKEPKKSEFGQYFFIENMMISIPKFPIYEYGDTPLIRGVPSLKKSDKGELLVLDKPQIEKLDSKNPFLSMLAPIRQRVLGLVMSSITSREAGLLAGIFSGC